MAFVDNCVNSNCGVNNPLSFPSKVSHHAIAAGGCLLKCYWGLSVDLVVYL